MFWHAFQPSALALANGAVLACVLVADPPWRVCCRLRNTDLQVLVFASRGTGQSAVFFVIFIVCWLTLAMLTRGQGPCFTLRPEGGAVVDGLGNFHSFCHFESCSCQVSFCGVVFCVFVQRNAFSDFPVLWQNKSSLFVTGSNSEHVKHNSLSKTKTLSPQLKPLRLLCTNHFSQSHTAPVPQNNNKKYICHSLFYRTVLFRAYFRNRPHALTSKLPLPSCPTAVWWHLFMMPMKLIFLNQFMHLSCFPLKPANHS